MHCRLLSENNTRAPLSCAEEIVSIIRVVDISFACIFGLKLGYFIKVSLTGFPLKSEYGDDLWENYIITINELNIIFF